MIDSSKETVSEVFYQSSHCFHPGGYSGAVGLDRDTVRSCQVVCGSNVSKVEIGFSSTSATDADNYYEIGTTNAPGTYNAGVWTYIWTNPTATTTRLWIRATSPTGNVKKVCADVTVVVDSTPPDPPTNVFLDLLVVTTGRLHANWTASTSSDVVGYEYKVQSEPNGAQSFSDLTAWAPTTGTDVKVSGLPLNITTHYRVCVRSKDAVGNYCTMAVSSSLLPNYGSFEYYYGYCVRNTADANVSNVYKQIDAGLWDIYHWNWTGVSGGCSVYGSPNYFGKSSQTWSSQTTADVLADFNQYNTIIFFCPDAPIEEKVEAAIEQFLGGFQKRLVLIGNAYGANHNPIVQLYSLNYNLNGLLQYLGCSTRFDYTDHPYPSGTFCVTPVSHYLTVQGSSPYTVTQLCGMEAGYLTGNNHTIAMRPVPDGCVWVCEEDIVNGGSIICIADSDSFSPSFGPDSTHNTSSWWASQHYGDARFLANLFSRFNR